MIKNFFYCFLTLCILTRCAKEDTSIFFGGKIIHPKSKYVVLFHKDKVIDTLYLDKKNKFAGRIKDANEGLFYFKHGVENQYLYLEPKDSIMLRLNTWDFDESLVFTGKGAERNNILMDCFLQYEKENKKLYHYNKFDSYKFKRKIDSILDSKEKTYDEYLKNHPNETPEFNKILKVALTYPVYSRAERFPIIHTKYTKNKSIKDYRPEFYKYREAIEINNEQLMYYPPYSNYVRDYLYNAAYSLGHDVRMREYSSEFTVDLLKVINDKITSEESKNAFLRQTVIEHFYKKSSCNINKETFNTYFNLTTNTTDKDRIELLLNDLKTIHKKTTLINFDVFNYKGEKDKIKNIVKDTNSLIFFWNPEFVSHDFISARLNFFTKKYRNIKFITVRIDAPIKKLIHKIAANKQFYIDVNSEANVFLTSKLPRAIIVNSKGTVVNGYASISSRKIHSQLKKVSKTE